MKCSWQEDAPHRMYNRQQLFELLLKDAGIDLPPRSVIPRRAGSRPCRLTAAQEEIWHAWRAGSANGPRHEVVLLRLTGALNLAALTQALCEMVRRHDILRTRFIEVDGQLCQCVSAETAPEVRVTDLCGASPSEQEAMWRWLSAQETTRAFDLGQLPLIRSRIIKLRSHEHLLLMTLHQIVCDGWSRKLLVKELGRLYQSFIAGAPAGLAEPEIQYADFAAWQKRRLEAGELDQDVEYWKQRLGEGMPRAHLLAHLAGCCTSSYQQADCPVRLGEFTSQQLSLMSRSQELTPFMILLAAWLALLSRYSSQKEVAVGTVVANRGRAELRTLIGPVSNTLLIKVGLSDNPSLREILRRVREAAIDTFEHQELPGEWVSAEMAQDEPHNPNGFAAVMFVMEEEIGKDLKFGGLKVIEKELQGGPARSHLALVMRRAGARFEGRIEYNAAAFEDEKIMRMAAGYQRLIEVILSDLDCRIRNLPPLVD